MTLPLRTPSNPSFPLFPWPRKTRPSGRAPGPRCVLPAMILETREHARLSRLELHLDRDVPDQPGVVRADGTQVDKPHSGERLVSQLIRVAEELIATADREDHRAASGGCVQGVALDRRQVERAQLLVAILTAADVVEVGAVWVELVAEAAVGDREANPSPGTAALEQQQVAPVRVDVHQVWVQRADAELRHEA